MHVRRPIMVNETQQANYVYNTTQNKCSTRNTVLKDMTKSLFQMKTFG